MIHLNEWINALIFQTYHQTCNRMQPYGCKWTNQKIFKLFFWSTSSWELPDCLTAKCVSSSLLTLFVCCWWGRKSYSTDESRESETETMSWKMLKGLQKSSGDKFSVGLSPFISNRLVDSWRFSIWKLTQWKWDLMIQIRNCLSVCCDAGHPVPAPPPT